MMVTAGEFVFVLLTKIAHSHGLKRPHLFRIIIVNNILFAYFSSKTYYTVGYQICKNKLLIFILLGIHTVFK